MQFGTYVALYFILWWVCFFVALPIGNRSQADEGERLQGTDPGAPPRLRLLIKIAAASVAALVLLFVVEWVLDLEALQDYWR